MKKLYTILVSLHHEILDILSFFPEGKERIIQNAFTTIPQNKHSVYLGKPGEENIRIRLDETVFRRLINQSFKKRNYINYIAGEQLSDYIIKKLMNNHDYIQVKSIDEIDTSGIPVSAISRYRYIDKYNNRYALRFNLHTRKIEITRLVSKENAHIVSKEMFEKKLTSALVHATELPTYRPADKNQTMVAEKIESENFEQENMQSQSVPTEQEKVKNVLTDDIDLDIYKDDGQTAKKNDIPENKEEYIRITLKKIHSIKERIVFLINNLHSSRVFEIVEIDHNTITDLSHEFDLEIFQEIENAEKHFRELTEYPRPISYYISKYEKQHLHLLDRISTNEEKMKLLIKWEMEDTITSLLERLRGKLNYLLEILNRKTEDYLNQISYSQKRMFQDAKNAALLCVTEADILTKRHTIWKEISN